jgi:hypothetical protein
MQPACMDCMAQHRMCLDSGLLSHADLDVRNDAGEVSHPAHGWRCGRSAGSAGSEAEWQTSRVVQMCEGEHIIRAQPAYLANRATPLSRKVPDCSCVATLTPFFQT